MKVSVCRSSTWPRTFDAPLPAAQLREAARPYEIVAATDAHLRAFALPAYAPGVE